MTQGKSNGGYAAYIINDSDTQCNIINIKYLRNII